jgi:protoporphyrinogen oxidase
MNKLDLKQANILSEKKVVIIGAGCAGLSAAYTLSKQGVETIVYEASEVAGGRCRTEWEDGYEITAGAATTEPQWATTFQYIKELGLEDRVLAGHKLRFAYFINGKLRTVFLGTSIQTLGENICFFLNGFPKLTYLHIARAFIALRKYMKRVDTKSHDFSALREISNMSTKDFLTENNAPLAHEWMFYPFMTLMVMERPSEISIAHPISLFSLMKDMRSLDGGLGMVTAGLYEQVKDCVRLNTPVNKVVIQDGKVLGVETSEGFIEADQVICAVDAVVARQIIPDLPESMYKPLETCKYSSTYYYQFGLEKPIINWKDTPFYVIVMSPASESFLNFASLGHPSQEKPVAIVATSGRFDDKLCAMNDEERRRAVIKEVQRFAPFFPDEPKLTRYFRWDRAINTEPPGQYVAIQDLLNNHMRDVKGLYLAGEYLFLIACTEGALATGKKAAEMVLEDLAEGHIK